jgi:hypothetical protein
MVFASARKMKRTHREQLQQIENMNRDAINHLLRQSQGLAEAVIALQKLSLAVQNLLKRRGLIDDFGIQQELSAIEEMQQMEQKALIVKGK